MEIRSYSYGYSISLVLSDHIVINCFYLLAMKEKSLVLERRIRLFDRTVGVLKFKGVYMCNTLEPAYRDYANGEKKVKGYSCIPAGTYQIELRKSFKFKGYRVFLKDVPMFNGILIHEGNTPDDTAGCILLGRLNKKSFNLSYSKITVGGFVGVVKYYGFETITIKDMFDKEESFEIGRNLYL